MGALRYTDFFFLVFLALVYGLFRLCPRTLRSPLLLVASYLFYLTWSPKAAVLLFGVTTLIFLAALVIERTRSRWLAPATVALLSGYLLAFKIALLGPTHGIAGMVMPLGISYTTFKLISYILEVHWAKMKPARTFSDFAGYIAFFPQILAGPIQRPANFFEQLPPVTVPFSSGLSRIVLGLVKKLLIADNLAPAVNYVYAHLTGLHGAPLWAAFYLFPLQLYADFSGLTDIAIGTGQLFGITGPENFNRPFTASSVSDFWRRWHMSLTTWLSDYVFMPLRMATRNAGNFGLAISIAINMTAIGLWHGLTFAYLAFGLIHSFYLIVDALTSRARSRFFKRNKQWDTPANYVGCLLTFHLVALAMVFFRAPHVSDAFLLLGNLFASPSSLDVFLNLFTRALVVGLIGYALLELAERFRPDRALAQLTAGPRWIRWSAWGAAAILMMFGVALLLAHSGGPHTPFLYEIF